MEEDVAPKGVRGNVSCRGSDSPVQTARRARAQPLERNPSRATANRPLPVARPTVVRSRMPLPQVKPMAASRTLPTSNSIKKTPSEHPRSSPHVSLSSLTHHIDVLTTQTSPRPEGGKDSGTSHGVPSLQGCNVT